MSAGPDRRGAPRSGHPARWCCTSVARGDLAHRLGARAPNHAAGRDNGTIGTPDSLQSWAIVGAGHAEVVDELVVFGLALLPAGGDDGHAARYAQRRDGVAEGGVEALRTKKDDRARGRHRSDARDPIRFYPAASRNVRPYRARTFTVCPMWSSIARRVS